jgi:membrane fusion protein, multidrug efflux system
MKTNIILFALLFAAAAAVAFFAWPGTETIAVAKPQRGPAIQAVYTTGTVEPSVMISIAPRQTARLITLLADEGAKVEKGAILAQLEDTDLQKTLAELQAQFALTEKEYMRKAELFRRKATSEQDLDQAQAARDAAIASVERAKAQLSYLQLLAPESGVIIRRDGETGEIIPVNQPVFWMSCCKPLRIASEVDEEDISLVTAGQEVLISADAFPGQTFKGEVLTITPKGDPVARSYRVRIGLEDKTPLMIGMTAETNIVTRKTDNALLIPAGAISGDKAWIVESGKARSVRVETGAKTSKAVEIVKGLDEKSIVIVDPPEGVADGDSVSAKMQDWQAR